MVFQENCTGNFTACGFDYGGFQNQLDTVNERVQEVWAQSYGTQSVPTTFDAY